MTSIFAKKTTKISDFSSPEGKKLIESIKSEFTPEELQVLLEFKKKYPSGMMGYNNALKVAKNQLGWT